MKKKQLYMTGNSHIDPVWFWEFMGNACSMAIWHHEIQTIKTDREGRNIKIVNLLEWEEERDRDGER